MGPFESSAAVVVIFTVVDEDVFDGTPVRLSKELRAAVAHAENEVAVAHAVQLFDPLKARDLESRDRFLHALVTRRSNDYERHRVSFRRDARRSGMPSFTISSTGASRIACTEPKCRRSARLRAGPIPSTESSGDVSALRDRTLR